MTVHFSSRFDGYGKGCCGGMLAWLFAVPVFRDDVCVGKRRYPRRVLRISSQGVDDILARR